jgi:Cd2+/Zn2+-exporting ATPase/Cu+-exporting ATPase
MARLGFDIPAGQSASAAEVFVAQGSRLLGKIQISDSLRCSAAPAVRALQQLKLRVTLLTGDSLPIAQAIASELGVDDFAAGLLPEGKLQRVRQMQAASHKVAMVGDGINDAPALTEAHVGVAMGSGTDFARETGNIILIGNDLAKFSEVVGIAKRCRGIIMTNFAGTIAVDLAGITLAMCGLLNPIAAALIHVCSELAFILNSARLLPALSKESINSHSRLR